MRPASPAQCVWLLLIGVGLGCAEVGDDGSHAGASTPNLRALYDPALLPILQPGVKAAAFSSYDRTGGNDDGFAGTDSKLRLENGDSVIAEMDGPGAITRIWTTHAALNADGILPGGNQHIRVYLDGAGTPVLDVPLRALFDASLERFQPPVAGSGFGGFYSYVPIYYLAHCKVVIEGDDVRFYQIGYVTLPSTAKIKPFSLALTRTERDEWTQLYARWNDALSVTQRADVQTFALSVNDSAHDTTINASALRGPKLVLGVSFEGELGDGEIELHVDGAAEATFRLPLALFFGGVGDSEAYESLFTGQRGALHYNLLPFYVHDAFEYVLHPGSETRGELVAYAVPIKAVPENAGRLRAQLNVSTPTTAGVSHTLLTTEGAGRYVGTQLVTDGPSGVPTWFEGDDIWTIDGEVRIHGTGTEDYFNGGWYGIAGRLDHAGGMPSHGFPVYENDQDRMRLAAYRWHLADPVPFDTALDLQLEHGGENDVIANYTSVAWYYVR